ncbi:MAG: GPR endopeptidase [Ruminococcaceae bacterium]|nr:GPR endopeptidase [Oscillospiraceae bacterium]
MEKYVNSDLAVENFERLKTAVAGVEVTDEEADGLRFQRVIVSPEATEALGKPTGTYVTVTLRSIRYADAEKLDRWGDRLSEEILSLCGETEKPLKQRSILAVGLGNQELTADAVGPQTALRLTATRHLKDLEPKLFSSFGCGSLSILTPNVLGKTGIEAAELIRAAAERVKPDLIILVDALAASSLERLGTTVQLTDSGIVPGSGVGNHRSALNRETLGAPVIAIGVPTVVSSSTLVCDTLERSGLTVTDPLLVSILENGKSFFVSPKDCDVLVELFAELLSGAIERAFLGELSL